MTRHNVEQIKLQSFEASKATKMKARNLSFIQFSKGRNQKVKPGVGNITLSRRRILRDRHTTLCIYNRNTVN